jgi:tRNA dimethylallyltransferase
LEAQVEREGPRPLLEELARVDPDYAARVDQSNLRRVIRALEVYHHTGRPLSASQTRQPPDMAWTAIGLACRRNELYRLINTRVDAMMTAGFLDEVRALTARGYGCDLPSMSGIGYRQLCQHLAGELSLDEAVSRVKTQTHRLARMQHSWFRQDDARIHWIDVTAGDPFANALSVVESKLIAS